MSVPRRWLRLLVEDDLPVVDAPHATDLVAQLALEPVHARPRAPQLVLEPEHVRYARQVEPELGRQPLDHAQALEIGLRVEARAAGGTRRPHEALRLVHPQRLLVHADELGRDTDHVAGPVGHQRLTFRSSSSSSRSFFETFAGTVSFSRASRSPLPPPLSFGAPRPLTLSS